jgi:hypothetical protein
VIVSSPKSDFSACPTFDHKTAETPPRLIGQLCAAGNRMMKLWLCPPIQLSELQSHLICPRLAVSASQRAGGAKYLIGHLEISRSPYPSIIRSGSAVRRKNLKMVRRIADASRPRPA